MRPVSTTAVAELKELKSLLDSGVLTQAEFDDQKRPVETEDGVG